MKKVTSKDAKFSRLFCPMEDFHIFHGKSVEVLLRSTSRMSSETLEILRFFVNLGNTQRAISQKYDDKNAISGFS